MSLSKLFTLRGGAAALAACAALTLSPGEARASHEQIGTIGLLAMTLAHTQLVPAYLSTGYYAYASTDRMPPAWTTMNVITGTAAASVGVAMMAAAVEEGDTDHGPTRTNSTEIITGVFGGITLAAGLTVSVMSIVYGLRSEYGEVEPRKKGPTKTPPQDEKVKWSFLVVPSASVGREGARSGSLTLIGTF